MDIRIIGEIGWDVDATELIDEIRSADEEIILHIMSGGGSAIHGLAIYDVLRASNQRVTAKIYGLAASAASVIAMAADSVEMGDGALMMIHEPWSMSAGNAEDMRKDAEVLDVFKARLIQTYINKTGQDSELITEMVESETWMSVDDAIQFGFADEKLAFSEVAASAGLLLTRNKKESVMASKKVEEPKAEVEEIKAAVEVKAEVIEPKAEVIEEPKAEVKEPVKAEKELSDYMASFGDAEGARMFVNGVSFSDAQNKHIDSLKASNTAKDEEIKNLKIIIEAAKADIGGDPLALGTETTEPKSKTSIINIQR